VQARAIHASETLSISGADARALLASSTLNSEIPANEIEALQDLYKSTRGDSWFEQTGWMGNESPCSWYGIVCDGGHVVEVYLSSNGLVGDIPPTMGQMESLRYLDLAGNKLECPPEGLGDLVEIAPLVFALPNRSAVDWSKDTAVLVSAQVQSTPSAQITLTWPLDPNAAGYRIYRKSKSDTTWGTPVATPGATAVAYVETTVNGAAKEYRIEKDVVVPHPTGTPEPYTAYGYIYAGVEVSPTLQRGKVILIVDSNLTTALWQELVRLKQDLVGDGWAVVRHDVAQTATVSSIKSLIQADYLADPTQVRAVLLFGHIPVPYAGNLVPDGHVPEHRGAWPADVFYGDMDDVATGCQATEIWTDCTVNTDLVNSHLSGSIPPELGNLTNLLQLGLSENLLSGLIPPTLGNLSNLELLAIELCFLSGELPPELGNLHNLHSLLLYRNQLQGAIPATFGNLTNLGYLSLNSNRLSGPIPPELGLLTNVHDLILSGNHLSGSIPPELGNMSSLSGLELSDNQLSGEVPAELMQPPYLSWVGVDYNMVTPTDPTVIAWLNMVDPGWEYTQTVPPSHVQATLVASRSVTLTWMPILHLWWEEGFYEVSYATRPGGPYKVHGTTPNRATDHYEADDLSPANLYCFVVRTFTARPIFYFANEWWSAYSPEVCVGAPTAVRLHSFSAAATFWGRPLCTAGRWPLLCRAFPVR
ncbi:MAG: hypothetical protein WA089_20025, partial [Anaerolineae bacterium]